MKGGDVVDRASARIGIGFLCIGLGGLSLRIAFLWHPVSWLVPHLLADDMFYYLTLARNVLAGHGVTFDGAPTNGFHPLYLLLLVFLGKVFSGSAVMIYAAEGLLLLADLGALWLLHRIAERLGGRKAALWATALWAWNPLIAAITFAGVEAPLAVFFLAATTLTALDLRGVLEAGGEVPAAHWVRLGALGALTLLSRTDTLFFILFLGVALLAWLMASPGPGRPRSSIRAAGWALRCAFPALLTGTLLLLPWICWNFAHFGRISQDSAAAIAYKRHELFRMAHGGIFTSALPFHLWQTAVAYLERLVRYQGMGWGNALPLLLLFLFVRRGEGRFRWGDGRLSSIGFLPAGAFALFLFYGLYFWHRQPWYYLSTLWTVALTLGVWLGGVRWQKGGGIGGKVPGLLLLLIAVGYGVNFLADGVRFWHRGLYPAQAAYHEAALFLKQHPPPPKGGAPPPAFRGREELWRHRTIGSFNSGIYAYFSTLPVVNLDGVVNGASLLALRERRLLSYLSAEGITHLLDHAGVIYAYAPFAESAAAYREALGPGLRFSIEAAARKGGIATIEPVALVHGDVILAPLRWKAGEE